MSLLDKTLPGSYDGVGFLVEGMGTSGGIKSVKHTFPNSDNQVIEQLGRKQNTFIINAVINNNPKKGESDNYKSKRDLLISTLDNEKTAVLIHPLFGHLNNIVCTDWNLAEDFSQLGIAKFRITFEVSLGQSVPQVAANTESQVANAGLNATDQTSKDIADNYEATFQSNVVDGIAQVNDIVAAFSSNTSLFQVTSTKINNFNSQLGKLSANVANLVRSPQELAQSIDNLFLTTAGMYATIGSSFAVMSSFFGFGDDDNPIDTDTQINIERKKNRELLNNSMNAYALSNAYTLASQLEFETIEEQELVANDLQLQYFDTVEGERLTTLAGATEVIGLSTDTLSLLTDQRITVQKLFDDDRVSLGQIITVFTHDTSSRLLAYQYYGESSKGEEIAILNGFSDSSFIFGDVKIITA